MAMGRGDHHSIIARVAFGFFHRGDPLYSIRISLGLFTNFHAWAARQGDSLGLAYDYNARYSLALEIWMINQDDESLDWRMRQEAINSVRACIQL